MVGMIKAIDQLIHYSSSALGAIQNGARHMPWFSRWVQRETEQKESLQKVKDIFQNALQWTQRIFAKIWDQAAFVGRIQGNPKSSFLESRCVYHGKGCQMEWESSSNPKVHGLMGYLLGKDHFSAEWLDDSIYKAIFVQKDPNILRCMREEFKNVLAECAKHLPVVGSPKEILFQTFVGNCLALLPYSYPEVGEVYAIPLKMAGQWQVGSYTVDNPIELTPRALATPILAFGLTSLEGPPLLSIIGTTYPAGDGFLATILSDTTPGMSVGHAAYLLGRANICAWLKNKEQVRLFGMSLGGSLCFHVLRNHSEKISQVDVYNPAGLYPWNWCKTFDRQIVNIYTQENDLVPKMGMFPTGAGVSFYRVLSSTIANCLYSHARVFTGGKEVTICKSSPEYENSRCGRRVLTAVHLLISPIVGFLCLCLVALVCLGVRLRYWDKR